MVCIIKSANELLHKTSLPTTNVWVTIWPLKNYLDKKLEAWQSGLYGNNTSHCQALLMPGQSLKDSKHGTMFWSIKVPGIIDEKLTKCFGNVHKSDQYLRTIIMFWSNGNCWNIAGKSQKYLPILENQNHVIVCQ